MPNEDLEKTTKIDTLDELATEKKEDNLDESMLDEVTISSKKKKKEKKTKKTGKIKNWWHSLSKKKKIIIIVIISLTVIAIGVGVFFAVKSLQKDEVVITPPVEEVIIEQENYRYENGKLVFLNEENEEIGSYECENKDENLCFVSFYSTEDDFDIVKKMYEDETIILERTPIINNNFVFINDNKENDETIKVYNIQTQTSLEETYRLVKKADTEGKSFILKNNTSNYGIVTFSDTEMTNKLSFDYDYLGFTNNTLEYYIATKTNRTVIINNTGKNISKSISGKVKGLNKNHIKVMDESGKYNVYDYNGKEIFNGYDYIELYDEYAALISEEKLTLKFYDNSKLHEEEINLFNTNYLKTNVYDIDKKLKETKESFYIEENENTISINVIKNEDIKTTTLNKLEGLKSKAIKYISYFDGKLYIYKDVEKTELLGTYTCNNKNNITSETSELANCYIAKDTVFENNDVEAAGVSSIIPIFNERYIFINDNPDVVNDDSKTIVLYDITKKSTISKYNSVNTYSYTGLDEVSFKTTGTLQVVAKNKSGKFGVIKIGAEEVSAHIPFKYTSIEKIGDYYAVNDGTGYTLLSKESGTALFSTPVAGKIRNYNDNYVTGVENNQYYVYSHEGKRINETGYKYIALYTTFYAAVNNENKLSLHLYQKPEENFLETEVALNLNNYYGSGMVAFKINVSGLSYTVEVGTTANTYDIKASGTIPAGDEE